MSDENPIIVRPNENVSSRRRKRIDDDDSTNSINQQQQQQQKQKQDHETDLDRQMKTVMQLMNARTAGKVSNDTVEEAVQKMLEIQSLTTVGGGKIKNNNNEQRNLRMVGAGENTIKQDEENYDDDDVDEETTKTCRSELSKGDNTNPVENETIELSNFRSRRSSKSPQNDKKFVLDMTIYEEIPLGEQGAKMMTNFGDGKAPLPETVEATLLGARRMLQAAIQDSRYIRRKQKILYKGARESLREKPVTQSMKGEWSSELLFRAGERMDRLSKDPKCGFDIEEVRHLFPEEMNAFTRWLDMHKETSKSNKVDEEGAVDENEMNNTVDNNDDDNGHLRDRAAHFDIRTDKMKGEWYMKFAEVRKGSFLPRYSKGRLFAEDTEWETKQPQTSSSTSGTMGRRKETQGTWAQLSTASVRFLHWIGFDPQSPLPPPNDITTQALAFLGYDFFGRIVEKALFLRSYHKNKNVKKKRNSKMDEADYILELGEGEQLQKCDIDRAMLDPEIIPVSLCSGVKERKLIPQLYFGPGFEDRLEMEMEEYLRSNDIINTLSEDEILIRNEEDALFQKLALPPNHQGFINLLKSLPEQKQSDDANVDRLDPTSPQVQKHPKLVDQEVS